MTNLQTYTTGQVVDQMIEKAREIKIRTLSMFPNNYPHMGLFPGATKRKTFTLGKLTIYQMEKLENLLRVYCKKGSKFKKVNKRFITGLLFNEEDNRQITKPELVLLKAVDAVINPTRVNQIISDYENNYLSVREYENEYHGKWE